MLTTGEQRELRLIEEELQNSDRRFVWQLTLVQGMLRWAAPGRQGCLLILAALAAALVRFAAVAERLLKELARGAVLMEPTIMVIPGGTAWPDWKPEQDQPSQRKPPARSDGRGENVQEQPDVSS
jgi:hypothetical protein